MAAVPFTLDSHVDLRATTRGRWVTLAPITYCGATETFLVPPGFTTDLASVPRAFTVFVPRYGTYTRAAVLHDLLCVQAHHGLFRRRDADGIFRRVLREEGVHPVLRWTMWAAVRAGGRMSGADARQWAAVSAIGLGWGAVAVAALAGLVLLARI
jgi:hypothetical protein